jgi:HTH-type transcriptional regulator/antitoxin MqsA
MAKILKCQVCGSPDIQTVITDEIYRYKGKSLAIPDFKKTVCKNCGEDVGYPESIKASIPLLRDFQRKIDGFLTSKEIKAIRKSFGLTQDEFSELLGGGAKAFARYENGTVLQSKPMDNLLRGLREYPEMINLYKKRSLKVA